MENQTLSELVADVEKLVAPLGFKIESAGRTRTGGPFRKIDEPEDDEALEIVISRKGKLD